MNTSASATTPATGPAPVPPTAPASAAAPLPPATTSKWGDGLHMNRTSKIAGAAALGLLLGLAVVKVLQAD